MPFNINAPAHYPFAAIVGCERAKRALLLLAVDPHLKGVLIRSAPGSGKSVLARAFQSLLCSEDELAPPFVELPLNATEDRLLGGIDIERSLATGKRHHLPGLLARAHSGALYADDINLVEGYLVNQIASALDSGEVRVEREGMSETYPAEFVLIGTYNDEEGEVRSILSERIGVLVDAAPDFSVEERAEIMRRVARFQEDPASLIDEYAIETAALRFEINEARALLPGILVSAEEIRKIAMLASSLGVEGNRADIFAVRAARANAALAGRRALNDDDILAAIELVLLPRATTVPVDEESDSQPPDSPADNDHSDGKDDESPDDREAIEEERGALEELLIRAIDARAPDDLFSNSKRATRRAASGKRASSIRASGGRYARSVSRKTRESKIAIDATLRAAAPFQLFRKEAIARSAVRSDVNDRVLLTKDDLRYKVFKRRSGMLFIFAVDASGSMALNRMAQAKGALIRLLQEAYFHRDKVALISFRGEGADVLLPPTRSVELARRLVDALPAGGATPLAAGLIRAMEIARRARAQDSSQAMLVLFTDGRANVGLRTGHKDERAARAEAIREELRQIGAMLEFEGIASVVIDTRSKFVSGGDGRALAETIGSRYVYLPRAQAEAIYETVTSLAEDARSGKDEWGRG